ncbi:hypothetical protein [Streptomyces sp. SID12501]|uniref:Uncharacterized protein n=1 Tax=Streptomyces sp. SID12501 TaxID=2706042 RepID=A0A6B3BZA7_9ACTN|nr:hypothetical protein [Streptomyces sp. SID12501]NEC89688.1 hypothetical protein [Streptomyces sp. SID12501]
MPSVVGLLEQHELAARCRVDGLREEADHIQAELEWQEWVIARRRVDAVLAPDCGSTADTEDVADPRAAGGPPTSRDAAKPKAQVPVWREGLAWAALSVDYQRILTALADRARLHQGPLTCQEMAVLFGLDAVPAKVEALRSKAKRLVARGWLAEPTPGRFMLAQGVAGPGVGS